jgi:tetraprenyl-beta-curcumene synthase
VNGVTSTSATPHASDPPQSVSLPAAVDTSTGASGRSAAARHLGLGLAFSDTVVRYLLLVLAPATSELALSRNRAAEIPNPKLRHHALRALAKRGNIEGAALFATLVPAVHRRRTIRALVAYQSAYNYLDALSELPSDDPIANGEQLHQALLTALHPDADHPDYYAHNPDTGDGGYLNTLVDTCRSAVVGLPSFQAIAPWARAAAGRIVDFQALNLNERQGGHDALKRWATEAIPPNSGLQWWEIAAAAGSSLSVHALIAASADAQLDSSDGCEIDRAYFPWIGALHSLLDSLVDRDEDRQREQRSLLRYYCSPAQTAIELGSLAGRARTATDRLAAPDAHRVILTAMCSYYLSAPQCYTAEAQTITHSLSEALGVPLHVAIALFRVRRLATALTGRSYT